MANELEWYQKVTEHTNSLRFYLDKLITKIESHNIVMKKLNAPIIGEDHDIIEAKKLLNNCNIFFSNKDN